jgi:energy-coupling factor transporter ATP-binding protein EcfA2
MYKRLKLHNFTVFADVAFEFSPGLNAYVGGNGSGKTHLLKILYSLQKNQVLARVPGKAEALDRTLTSVFKPDALGRLVRRKRGRNDCDVEASWGARRLTFHLSTSTKKLDIDSIWRIDQSPILIPAKDILGHSVNFVDAYDTVTGGRPWLDFDVTYRDLLTQANPDVPKGPTPESQKPLLEILRKHMSGTVQKSDTGRYYLIDSAGKIEFPLIAEGWRKLGLLWTLIRNGSLGKGSVLYWDEPEANLNPSMFPVVAEILSKLANSGTQIHIATHSYALLRELEFAQKEGDNPYRIFALDRTSEGVQANAFTRFADLKPNPILDEYERIYSLSVREALKGG